jgi:O-antigen/teichoic acid export membrane protein
LGVRLTLNRLHDRLPPRFRRFFADGVWLFLGKLVATGATLLVTALLARMLEPAALGVFLLALSLSTTLCRLGSLGVNFSAVRFMAEALALHRPADARWVAIRCYFYGLGGASVLFLLIGLFPGPQIAENFVWSQSLADNLWLIGLWAAFTSQRLVLFDSFRGLGEARLGTWFDGAMAMGLAALLFAIWWAVDLPFSLETSILICAISAAGAVFVGTVFLIMLLHRLIATSVGATGKQPLLRLGLPLMMSGFVIAGTIQVSLWVLTALRPIEEVAVFGLASRMMLAVSLVFILAHQLFAPLMASMMARGERAELEDFVRTTITIVLAGCVLISLPLIIFPRQLLTLLFGESYAVGAWPLVILTLAQLVQVISGPAQTLLSMSGNERAFLALSLVAFVLAALLTAVLSPVYGALGAAIATAVAIAGRSIGATVVAYRRCGIATWPRCGF